jgi:hypothetical protein
MELELWKILLKSHLNFNQLTKSYNSIELRMNRSFQFKSLIIMSGNLILNSLLNSMTHPARMLKPMRNMTQSQELPSLMRTSQELSVLRILKLQSRITENSLRSILRELMVQTVRFHVL